MVFSLTVRYNMIHTSIVMLLLTLSLLAGPITPAYNGDIPPVTGSEPDGDVTPDKYPQEIEKA